MRAICILGRTYQSCLFSSFHSGETLVPAFDDTSLAEHEVEGIFAILVGVKDSSVLQTAFVCGKDLLPFLR